MSEPAVFPLSEPLPPNTAEIYVVSSPVLIPSRANPFDHYALYIRSSTNQGQQLLFMTEVTADVDPNDSSLLGKIKTSCWRSLGGEGAVVGTTEARIDAIQHTCGNYYLLLRNLSWESFLSLPVANRKIAFRITKNNTNVDHAYMLQLVKSWAGGDALTVVETWDPEDVSDGVSVFPQPSSGRHKYSFCFKNCQDYVRFLLNDMFPEGHGFRTQSTTLRTTAAGVGIGALLVGGIAATVALVRQSRHDQDQDQDRRNE